MSVKLRTKLLKNNRRSLYLDIYWARNRRFQFLNVVLDGNKDADREKWKIAETERAKVELGLLSARYDWNPSRDVNFFDYCRKIATTKNPANQQLYHQLLTHLERHVGSKNLLLSVLNNRDWLEHFKAHLLSAGLKSSSAGLYFTKLHHVIRTAIDEGLLPKDNSRGIRFPVQEHMIRFLTIDELRKLYDAECPDFSVKAAFLLASFTGLRKSDIQQLRWTDMKDNLLSKRQQKTGAIVHIPLSAEALHILSQLEKTDEMVFHLPNRRSTVNGSLSQWSKQAGVDRFTFHTARHSFAMLLLTSGASIQVISKLLGHSGLNMTLRYARILDSHQAEAVLKLPMLRSKGSD